MPTTTERIECLFQLLDEDYCSDKQLDLVESFRDQYIKRGSLSARQLEILEDISEKASVRDLPYRR